MCQLCYGEEGKNICCVEQIKMGTLKSVYVKW